MTREQMAVAVDDAARIADSDEAILVADELREVAAELRKTCATCQQFRWDLDKCVAWQADTTSAGFCHRWEPRS